MDTQAKTKWIVDDVQRIIEVLPENMRETARGKIEITAPASHRGQQYASEFVYENEEGANFEVHDRHVRLNRAFEKMDLLGSLSVSKEASRKSKGFSQEELTQEAEKDREEYAQWKENLRNQWKEINQEEPDMAALAKTLRNATLIQEALINPLAKDFTEILATESSKVKIRTLLTDRFKENPTDPTQDL